MLLVSGLGIVSASFESVSTSVQSYATNESVNENQTEYWALMVAVGVYKNNPHMDRPSMLVEIDHLKETLLGSSMWQEDHIKVIEGEDAVLKNVLDGFSWLDENEDEDDVCLVFLTSHGFPLLWDRPPFDEEDHMDEALAMYNGFLPFENPLRWEPLSNPFAVLTDDMVNKRLNNLESKSVCCIVDSCHSGGFGDYFKGFSAFASSDFGAEFAADVADQNRVVITSVPETETSYGSYLTNFLSEGLVGFGDVNEDGLCSAEEAYEYAEPIIRSYTSMRPQIFDNHPGELILTESNFPPQNFVVDAPFVVDAESQVDFVVSASDPEGSRVSYAVDWGDGSDSESEFVPSGQPVVLSHIFSSEGVFDLSFSCVDESGRESYDRSRSVAVQKQHSTDQFSMWNGSQEYFVDILDSSVWYAQSFSPNLEVFSSAHLCCYAEAGEYELTVEVCSDLGGDVLGSSTESFVVQGDGRYYDIGWHDFSFDNLVLSTDDQYYLVLRGSDEFSHSLFWIFAKDSQNDPYQAGELFFSRDAGSNWSIYNNEGPGFYDALFVTYGL